MMMKPYPDYKDSGVAWLGQIPAHWDALQNRALFKERITKGRIDEELLSVTMKEGIIKQKELLSESSKKDSSNEDKSNYKLVMPDDLAYNKMRMWQGAVGASKFQGIVSPAYVVIQPKSDVNSWYYHYLFRIPAYTNESYRHSYGICDDQLSLRYEDFKVMSSPKPPIEEQHKIVRFLDEKCEKIDRFIANKQRMAALLREQKQAVISAAVTGKLNACVSCAPCGSCVKNLNANDANGARDARAWFGEIPSHWEVRKLRTLLTPVSMKGRPDLPLLSVVREKGILYRSEMTDEENHNFIPDDLSNYKIVKKNQFVMNKMKAWQGSYGISDYDGIVSPAYYVFDCHVENKEFFHFAIRSRLYVDFFAHASDGIRIGQWDLSMVRMKDIPFLLPPKNEQEEIVSFIKEQTSDIIKIIARTEREITLMQEYRARLIADVVTGQIDVREKILTQTAQMTQEPQTL